MNYIYILENDNDNFFARKKEVILGEPLESQVLCENIGEGQQVITQGIKFIKEGDRVMPETVTEEQNEN